ncbi:MAG: RluA family pseudouridine synthase [Spirochaetales bacterium]|nr:RluA family pseudouridine synthase [Spirochaetales bacterium]
MADLDSGEVKLPLDGEAKMLGILACDDAEGNRVVLKAFSGQVCGQWVIPGWCEPAFSVSEYSAILEETDRQVKGLARQGKDSREVSAEAMGRLFGLYRIHCIDGSVKTYSEIFGDALPPSGTGDCAAIKLLNCAFKNHLKPISMAEFYYGGHNPSASKEPCQFYPPCEEKCRPLLKEMLGLDILYLDQEIVVVNKPAGLLSVPGRGDDKQDCVVSRVKRLFPDCIDNPSVHRLDMDTSGILVLALTKESQRFLSMEFESRNVHKKYTALLDGILRSEGGALALPFRLDPENRPYQVYDPVQGRMCITLWKRLSVYDGKTLVEFTPLTGRTHQLRVSAASTKGLGVPIVGDRLYGTRKEGQRLMLHAGYISFTHPWSKERIEFKVDAPF